VADDDVLTYEGAVLPLDESSELGNAFPTRVVLMMGEQDAGKTTLLAEVHHAYLKAPFAGFIFAGSKTLIGFEQRCFLSRFKSGQRAEDTERTKSSDILLLHMALTPEATPGVHTHLLFTDVSGERFRDIRASADEAKELAPLVRRANDIMLLVDGDCLSVAKTQMATQSNATVLLRCLLEAGGLGDGSSLHVVVSKWDFVVARGAESTAEQLEQAVRKVTRSLVPRFHRIAARVTNQVSVAPGFGLDGLVKAWMQQRVPTPLTSIAAATMPNDGRWYARYRFSRTS
jgi:hypothetical protein